ncbi:MAG: histidine kinase [Desulfobacteraceae bacterium]|nr:histidine kinase [Desulfobacteraceae bacterium]
MKELSVYTKKSLLDIIEALPLAIAVIDKNRRLALANRKTYLFVNKDESRLIGHVSGEAFGCAHHDDMPEGCGFGPECPKCKLREALLETMDKKKALSGVETTMVFKGLGIRHLRISTSPLTLNREAVVLVSIEDTTEAKHHEQIRLEKEKLAAVLKTTGGICHELNQPLMVILGFSDLLLEDLPKDDLQRFNLLEIKRQVERLGLITTKLMSITRFKTKKYLSGEIIDIHAASDENDEPDKEKES